MASGDFLGDFRAVAFVQETTNYPAQGKHNNQWDLGFDDTTAEAAYTSGVWPSNYSGGGVTAKVWVRAAATSGNVMMSGAFERQADGGQDTSADGYATAQNSSATTISATAYVTKLITIAFTNGAQMDSVVAGDPFRFKLARVPGSDSMTGDARVLGVTFYET